MARAALVLLLGLSSLARAADLDARGGQFIGFDHFSAFERTTGSQPGEIVLTSPVITTQIPWEELVVSWNSVTPDHTYLKVEARALFALGASRYYTMGRWSSNPAHYPRESVKHQADAEGDVSTDTLILKRAAEGVQVRVTLGGDLPAKPELKFLGLSLTDTNVSPAPLPPNQGAWGQTLSVPQRSQMNYPNGKVLCSPTTVSMIVSYWAQELKRPELDHDVPDLVAAIYDPVWKGTGNWVFNTAYAGSWPGLRAYVARLTDLCEVEDWIASGIPVGLSVCSDRLHHRGPGPNGHLIVCVGFTKDGDVVVNDPGSSKNVRRIYPRADLLYAWAYSRNTVYLIYPETAEVPKDRFGHWDSWTSHQRAALGQK